MRSSAWRSDVCSSDLFPISGSRFCRGGRTARRGAQAPPRKSALFSPAKAARTWHGFRIADDESNPLGPLSMPLVHCHTACRLLAGLALAATLGLAAGAGEAAAQSKSRIKDVADFEGVRDNLLVGYGLVVGLNGSGDGLDSAVVTRESLSTRGGAHDRT